MPPPVPAPLRSWVAQGAFAAAWQGLYEFYYYGLRIVASLLFRPLFLVRRVGRAPVRPRGGVIFCPNHQSYLDPAFVQMLVRPRVTFMMTNDFYRKPVVKWFFMLVGAIPVGSGRLSWGGMRRAAALLRCGRALVVFPEGRLTEDGSLHRAQRGVASLARRGRASVIPVAIEGSIGAWPRGARWLRRADVRLAFGAPMAWETTEGREAEQAFADRILAAIADLRRGMPRRPGVRPGA